MRIAFDPTPLHSTHSFLEFPRTAADLGYEWIQLSPHLDCLAPRPGRLLDREDALIVSNVFAEDEKWEEVSRFQLQAIKDGVCGRQGPVRTRPLAPESEAPPLPDREDATDGARLPEGRALLPH